MSNKELLHMPLDDGVTIAYRLSHSIDKSLATIVMHHAFLMDSRFYDRQFQDIRYSLYNLISIDAHGHGETTGREENFTFWDTASDSLKLLTKLGIEQFYVFGTTQGGFIALRMALLEPQRIRGLILLDISPFCMGENLKMNLLQSRDKWCQTKVPSEEAMLLRARSFGGPTRVEAEVYEKVKQMWTNRYAGTQGYNPAFNCLLNRDAIDDRLTEINVPTLVLHGTDDSIFPVEEAKTWIVKLPKLWKFVIVERGVHHLSFTDPGDEIVAQLVPPFIKETLSTRLAY